MKSIDVILKKNIEKIKFLSINDPIAEDYAKKIIFHLSQLIWETLKQNQNTLIGLGIIGSYAKSEGSVIKLKGEYIFMKDVDFLIYSHKNFDMKKLKSKCMKLINSFHDAIFNLNYFTVDINLIQKNKILIINNIANYDLQNSIKILFGDLRIIKNISRNHISLQSGMHLLCQKLIGLLFYFPFNNLNSDKLPLNLIFEITKTKAMIGCVILILTGKYEIQYTDNLENLKTLKNLAKNDELKKFIDLGLEGLEEKIYPNKLLIQNYDIYYFKKILINLQNAIDYFGVYCLKSINLINEGMLIQKAVNSKSDENVLTKFGKYYYDDLIKFNFKKTWKIFLPIYRIGINKLMFVFWKWRYFKNYRSKDSPILIIYLTALELNRMLLEILRVGTVYIDDYYYVKKITKLINYGEKSINLDKFAFICKNFFKIDKDYLGIR